MATLRILSAGAAQAVTERIIEEFKRDTKAEVVSNFGAVGAMKARITAGEAVDVIILTRPMIEELAGADLVEGESRVDLGKVGTGIAVRAGSRVPNVGGPERLRKVLSGAHRIVCPDPVIATAGKIVVSMLEKMGIHADVQKRLEFFPNGYAAMGWLAESGGGDDIGITQITEILPNKGVTLAGPLPDEFQMKAVYSAAISAKSQAADLANDFVKRFAAPAIKPLLAQAGYEA
jgi:molybdate transport system substrate-binding protein